MPNGRKKTLHVLKKAPEIALCAQKRGKKGHNYKVFFENIHGNAVLCIDNIFFI
jgi:hypothetical protein